MFDVEEKEISSEEKAQPRGRRLIDRYKKNYAIPSEAPVTEEMVLDHWELEKNLTEELLASDSENRWEVFDRCYTELYSQIEWLNRYVDKDDSRDYEVRFSNWLHVIGEPPQKIYEVGSGKAGLISFLAQRGFECKATEVTIERGQSYADVIPNLHWGISDGIHLGEFEPAGQYEVVISNQVIEHLHPDDVRKHFIGSYAILKKGGRYIFSVPHQCAGPADISSIFGCNEPRGMHLHEYTYGELANICKDAGFSDISAVLSLPVKVAKMTKGLFKPMPSGLYLHYSQALENVLLFLPPSGLRRKMAKLMRLLLFDPCIFMVATR
ncbi:SAM-dependent methyltransferase [candidate division LCP-89 bacterium B3_LCP]|uniref:SAM-dependent methyltransferase n=1 Tax=candidate division LCP-89 bacterium B3_LCP TaxID=2012998 RepID=A0A532V5R1_UNCL8|nr:MAG: SAM-dependent methyltransferase [candidate division LCP-89 bacterium B3_LCP]